MAAIDVRPPTDFLPTEQPAQTDWLIADDVFVKSIDIKKAGTVVPQHSHRYAHVTFLARGAIRVWQDDRYIGDYTCPAPLYIEAGVKHLFQTLEDDTTILCIHNAMRPDVAAVVDEHELEIG